MRTLCCYSVFMLLFFSIALSQEVSTPVTRFDRDAGSWGGITIKTLKQLHYHSRSGALQGEGESAEDDTSSKEVTLILRGGIKLPEAAQVGTTLGWSVGIAATFRFSYHITLQPEFNFWRSRTNSSLIDETVRVSELALLLSYDINPVSIGPVFSLGPGITNSKGGFPDKLLSFNFGLGLHHTLSQSMWLHLSLRYQGTGLLNVGDGDAYQPIIISTGLQFRI